MSFLIKLLFYCSAFLGIVVTPFLLSGLFFFLRSLRGGFELPKKRYPSIWHEHCLFRKLLIDFPAAFVHDLFILFLILQQIEGNLIYPHVVGNSVGLPSIWVLVAVTIGGNLMGILGMLIFIPICSVAYVLLREIVEKRLTNQKR